MEDHQIIELYFDRSESALSETQTKYGRYCHTIAYHILGSDEDAEECVNDTLNRAWNAIPPQRPSCLRIFLSKITRNLALDRFKAAHAEKRGCGRTAQVLDELTDCLPDPSSGRDSIADDLALRDVLNRFLKALPEEPMKLFLRRYWWMDSIAEIAAVYGMSESKVKSMLSRTRSKLKNFLESEGIEL